MRARHFLQMCGRILIVSLLLLMLIHNLAHSAPAARKAAAPIFFHVAEVRREGHRTVREAARKIRCCPREVFRVVVRVGETSRCGIGAQRRKRLEPRTRFIAQTLRLIVARTEPQENGLAIIGR